MIVHYSKRFTSTPAFYNNSAIILKLIWPKKANLLHFDFFKINILSLQKFGMYA